MVRGMEVIAKVNERQARDAQDVSRDEDGDRNAWEELAREYKAFADEIRSALAAALEA